MPWQCGQPTAVRQSATVPGAASGSAIRRTAGSTSVAGGFLVVELFAVSKTLVNNNGDAVVPILLGIAACYLIITIPLGQLAGVVERKVAMQR